MRPKHKGGTFFRKRLVAFGFNRNGEHIKLKNENTMKITSPEDLKKLRDQAKAYIDLRGGLKEIQVIVHMGTCGIAAGARDVLSALSSEMMQAGIDYVSLRRSGCIGLCDQEPMMTLKDKAGHEYQYVQLDAQKVHEIVQDHILGGQPVVAHLMHT